MDKMTILFLFIFLLYLFYSYIKSRPEKEREKKVEINEKKGQNKKVENEYEKKVIAAVIAATMQETPYRIKRVFLSAKEEKKSVWKITGRQESMIRRSLFSKKEKG